MRDSTPIGRNWRKALSTRNRLRRASLLPRKLKMTIGSPGWRTGATYHEIGELAAKLGIANTLTQYERKVFSQNGEDGVIAELVSRIEVEEPYFVEFGAGRGDSGNCVFLADVCGWPGLFIEAATDDYAALERKYATTEAVRTVREMVLPDSIDSIFESHGVPRTPTIVSIDIDGNDFYVWQALRSFRPAIVVIEYNGAIDLRERVVQPYDPDLAWDGSDYWGASLGALEALGRHKGYRLVHTDLTGANAFFVDEAHAEVFEGIVPPRRVSNYELLGIQHPADRKRRTYRSVGEDGVVVDDRV